MKAFNGDYFLAGEFLFLKRKYKIKSVIETGTHKGDTTKWLAENFENVSTVEIEEDYLKEATERLKEFKNIRLILGSSQAFLREMIEWTPDPLIIFLDAHWLPENPLLRELEIIKECNIKPILIIHDFKNPFSSEMAFDKYPNISYEWDSIKDKVENIYGGNGYTAWYNHKSVGMARGCLFIEPK